MKGAWLYLLEATPRSYTPGDPYGVPIPVYYATCEGEGPVLLNGHLYRRRMRRPPSFSVNAFQGPVGLGGASIPGRGTIDLFLGDVERATDDGVMTVVNTTEHALTTYTWDGAPLVVKRGLEGAAYGTFTTIFVGTCRHVTWDWDEGIFTIHLRDLGERLNVPIQRATYGGTGGVDGDASIKDQVKPLLLGAPRYVQPKLIDPVYQVYQIHSAGGSVENYTVSFVTGVFDAGTALGGGTDTVSSTALYGASIPSGDYLTCLAEGLIRLGAPPEGVVTCHAQLVWLTAADIITHLVRRDGVLAASEIATEWFDALNSVQPNTLGLALTEPRTYASVLDEICATIGAFWTWTPDGKLKVERLNPPAPSNITIPATAIGNRLRRVETGVPPHRVRLGYARTWRPHTPAELAADVRDPTLPVPPNPPQTPNPHYRADIQREYGFVMDSQAQSAVIQALYRLTEELELPTLFQDEAAAQDQADRYLFLLGNAYAGGSLRVDRYDVDVLGRQWTITLGNGVTIEHPTLPGGSFTGFVLGIDEAEDEDRTTLRLYG